MQIISDTLGRLKQALGMRNTLKLSIIFALILIGSQPSFAEFKGYKEAEAKSESKKKSGWSLEDWLAQRDRSRMMDLWLAMNTSESSEFYLAYSQLGYTNTTIANSVETSNNYSSTAGSFGAYSSIIGLHFDYQDNRDEEYTDLAGSLRVRVFGNADQATNLTFGIGQRTLKNTSDSLKFNFPEAQLNLHFLPQFGLHGLYQQMLPITSDTLGEVSGSKSEYGIFLDFKILRIFGNYYEEVLDSSPGNIATKNKKAGISSGLKLYF